MWSAESGCILQASGILAGNHKMQMMIGITTSWAVVIMAMVLNE